MSRHATQPGGLLTIDHIGVPLEADVVGAWRYSAQAEDKRLSDHDAYVVEIVG